MNLTWPTEDNKVVNLLLPRCACCGEVPAKGIKGGYLLNKAFLCLDCEKDIVNLNIDSPAYANILAIIKKNYIDKKLAILS